MQKTNLLLILLSILLSICSCSPTPGESVVSASIVGNSLKETADKIGWSIDRAASNSDYLLEKNLRSLQILSNTISHQLTKETAKNREYVSQQLAESVTRLGELIEQAQGGILEIEDFMVLDTQNIMNQIPLKTDLFMIRKIKGYGVQYRNDGEYEFEVIGNAFSPENKYKIAIDEKQIDINNVHSPAANVLLFSVPVSLLNSMFLVDSVNRVSLHIESFSSTGDTIYTFDGKVLLLPKLPVHYVVNEKYRNPVWGGPEKTKRFTRPMGPTGKNGVWHRYTLTGVVEDPNTQRFVKVIGIGTDGSHSYCKNAKFSNGNTEVTADCANQCHDCTRNGWIEVSYQELKFSEESKTVFFDSDKDKIGLLSYGTHFSRLDQLNQSWAIEIKFFNGRQITLHPQKLNESGVRAYLDSDQSSNFKQLIVEIKDPTFG